MGAPAAPTSAPPPAPVGGAADAAAPAPPRPGERSEGGADPQIPPPRTSPPCPPPVVEAMRAAPVVVGEVVTTIGDRLAAGVLPQVVPGLASSSSETGAWLCDGTGPWEVRFASRWRGAELAPRWTLPARGDDGAPPVPTATNLLAEAVHGTWSPAPDDAEAAWQRIESCAAPSGATVANGLFVLWMLEPTLIDPAAPVLWSVLPGDRVDGTATYRVTASWRTRARRDTEATWVVRPSGAGCAAGNALGARVLDTTAGIPDPRRRFGPDRSQEVDPPSMAVDASVRATSYLLAHRDELDAIADWIGTVERMTPYEQGPWVAGDEAGAGGVEVATEFRLGDVQHELRWRVRDDGVASPVTPVAAALRASRPRYRPGFDADAARSLPIAPDAARLDVALGAVAGRLLDCAPGATAARLRFALRWDGSVYGVSLEPTGAARSPAVDSCAAATLARAGLDRFSGPPVDRTVELRR